MCRGAFLSVFLFAWTSSILPVRLVSAGGLRGGNRRASAPIAQQATSVTPVAQSHLSVDLVSENDPDIPVPVHGDSFSQVASTKGKLHIPLVDFDMEDGSSLSEAELERELAAHPLMNSTLEEVDSDEAEDDELPEDGSEVGEGAEEQEDDHEDDHDDDDDHDHDHDDDHADDDEHGDQDHEHSEDPGSEPTYEEQVEHLTRIGELADANHDGLLSHSELLNFAEKLQNRKRLKHTKLSLDRLDDDADGSILRAQLVDEASRPHSNAGLRFTAADLDKDGSLNETELHFFSHPEAHQAVLRVEAEHQFEKFDLDKDGFVSFAEYKHEEEHEEGFDLTSAWEDFSIHDTDGSQDLSLQEFSRLLSGSDLLSSHIHKTIAAADSDGDGHIHLREEVPSALHGLLGTEFIEDYFYHEHLHDEL